MTGEGSDLSDRARSSHGRARDGLHAGGDADQVRARRGGGRRLGAQAPRGHAGAAGDRSGRGGPRAPRAGARGDRARGHRGRALRPRARGADARLPPGGRGLREGRRRRRVRVGRRRFEHRHRQGRRPDHHPSGGGHGLRQPAGGGGEEAAVAAQAAPGDPHDLGHGRRGHHGGGARRARPEGQDRHLASLPAPGAGHRRSRARAHAARRGDVVDRPRRRLPRRRVLSLQALRHPRAARVARRPPALPGRQPGGGRVVGQGPGVRRALPAPRRRGLPTTSRRAGR